MFVHKHSGFTTASLVVLDKVADIVYLDFPEAFHKFPHQRLGAAEQSLTD